MHLDAQLCAAAASLSLQVKGTAPCFARTLLCPAKTSVSSELVSEALGGADGVGEGVEALSLLWLGEGLLCLAGGGEGEGEGEGVGGVEVGGGWGEVEVELEVEDVVGVEGVLELV